MRHVWYALVLASLLSLPVSFVPASLARADVVPPDSGRSADGGHAAAAASGCSVGLAPADGAAVLIGAGALALALRRRRSR